MGLDDNFCAKHILHSDGITAEFYEAEYYIVPGKYSKKVKDKLLKYEKNYFLDQINFQSILKALQSELSERRANIGLAYLYEKTIYQKNSPALKNPWFEDSDLRNLHPADVQKIFNRYGQAKLFELSRQKYITQEIKIQKNKLISKRNIKLKHPDQKNSELNILIPLDRNKISPLLLDFYVRTLGDFKYGILNKTFRHDLGLVYRVFVENNFYEDALHISLPYNAEFKKMLPQVLQAFNSYNSYIKENYKIIAQSFINDYEMDWGNIAEHARYYIEDCILGKNNMDISERIT